MAKKLDFKDFLAVDYMPGATDQEKLNAKKRKKDIPTGNTNEAKAVEMCSDECCGQPVTECECGPDCPHCDCYEKNNMNEALTLQQRQKRARQMKKYKSKIKIGRERAQRRTADPARLKKRARKQARLMLAKKLAKADYNSLSYSRKQEIEKRLDKMGGRIDRVAKKLLPKMRKLEMERKRGNKGARLDRTTSKND